MADLCRMQAPATLSVFDSLPADARVWVYKSEKRFSAEQLTLIQERTADFTAGWSSHGEPVVAGFNVVDGHLVVIGADLSAMVICGGAVDQSVQFIKRLETDLGLVLTDRMVVLYEQGESINACRVPQLEGLLKDGTLTGDTVVYDDLVATKGELEQRLKAPLRTTWMARYL